MGGALPLHHPHPSSCLSSPPQSALPGSRDQSEAQQMPRTENQGWNPDLGAGKSWGCHVSCSQNSPGPPCEAPRGPKGGSRGGLKARGLGGCLARTAVLQKSRYHAPLTLMRTEDTQSPGTMHMRRPQAGTTGRQPQGPQSGQAEHVPLQTQSHIYKERGRQFSEGGGTTPWVCDREPVPGYSIWTRPSKDMMLK